MRRTLTTGLTALALTALLAACGTSSSGDSDRGSSKTSGTSSKSSSSGSKCIVGSWSATPEQLDFFGTESGDTETYSTPTGKVKFTFASDGDFTLFFDNVSSIRTEFGTSNTIAFNGSVGGTYDIRNSSFETTTTDFNISIAIDGQSLPPEDVADFEDALQSNDDTPTEFTCSGNKLTIDGDAFTRV